MVVSERKSEKEKEKTSSRMELNSLEDTESIPTTLIHLIFDKWAKHLK